MLQFTCLLISLWLIAYLFVGSCILILLLLVRLEYPGATLLNVFFTSFRHTFWGTLPMALVIALPSYFKNKQAYDAIGISPPPFWTDQKIELRTKSTIDELFPLCLKALKFVEYEYEVIISDKSQGVIQAMTKSPLRKRNSEKITITIQPVDNVPNKITVESRVPTPIRLIDNAMNLKNVTQIANFLRNEVHLLEA